MEDEIERTREMMIATASSKGLGASETIEVSRKLDALLNDYRTGLGVGKSDDIYVEHMNTCTNPAKTPYTR